MHLISQSIYHCTKYTRIIQKKLQLEVPYELGRKMYCWKDIFTSLPIVSSCNIWALKCHWFMKSPTYYFYTLFRIIINDMALVKDATLYKLKPNYLCIQSNYLFSSKYCRSIFLVINGSLGRESFDLWAVVFKAT